MRRSGAGSTFTSRLSDVETMAMESGALEADAGGEERRLNLQTLVRLGRDYATLDPAGSVDGFLAWLRASGRGEGPQQGSDAVELTTFHRAKGLEWPVVVVAGLENGLVPIGRARTPEAEDEERRLLHVALTRALDEVHCTWAEHRTFASRTIARSPSPYLELVEAAIATMAPGADNGPVAIPPRLRAQRDVLRERRHGAPSGGGAPSRARPPRAPSPPSEPGARPPPVPPASPRSSSSTTPPWAPWPRLGPPHGPSCWRFPASGR